MKRILVSACVIMALAVILGAFGSHGLSGKISDQYMDIYKTANFYHYVHGMALIVITYILNTLGGRRVLVVANLFFAGIILFSGSLYLLSVWEIFEVPEMKKLGAVAPIGGLAFVAAWLLAAYEFRRLYHADKNDDED